DPRGRPGRRGPAANGVGWTAARREGDHGAHLDMRLRRDPDRAGRRGPVPSGPPAPQGPAPGPRRVGRAAPRPDRIPGRGDGCLPGSLILGQDAPKPPLAEYRAYGESSARRPASPTWRNSVSADLVPTDVLRPSAMAATTRASRRPEPATV